MTAFYTISSTTYHLISAVQFIPLRYCGAPPPRLVQAYVHDIHHVGITLTNAHSYSKNAKIDLHGDYAVWVKTCKLGGLILFSFKVLQCQLIWSCNVTPKGEPVRHSLAYWASGPKDLQFLWGKWIKIPPAIYKAQCPPGLWKLIPQQSSSDSTNDFEKPLQINKHEAVYRPVCTGCLRNGWSRSKPRSESWVLPEGTILQRRHIPVLPRTRKLQWTSGKSAAALFLGTDMVNQDSKWLTWDIVQISRHHLLRECTGALVLRDSTDESVRAVSLIKSGLLQAVCCRFWTAIDENVHLQ